MKITILIKKGFKKMKDKVEKRCELISKEIYDTFPYLRQGEGKRVITQYFLYGVMAFLGFISMGYKEATRRNDMMERRPQNNTEET